jgi:hypothetical protein
LTDELSTHVLCTYLFHEWHMYVGYIIGPLSEGNTYFAQVGSRHWHCLCFYEPDSEPILMDRVLCRRSLSM